MLTEQDVKFDEKKMALILKPTEACNFSCNFCSSSNLVEDKRSRLGLDRVIQFLIRFPQTKFIFVVGGDPLMMDPEYYWALIEYLEQESLPAVISMTTNLWDFYKKPEKWKDLFLHPKIEVGTSFQFGGGRLIKPGVELTEVIFTEIVDLFKKEVKGKELCFLAVVNKDNEHLALNNVYLAQKLNIQCRLVWMSMSGRSTSPYPMAKLYKIIIQIWKLGLSQFEQTALNISEKLRGIEVSCPLSRNCDGGMRSLNPDGRYFSCGPLNDDLDKDNEIDFESEVVKGENFFLPIQTARKNNFLKDECVTCPMFQMCNSCWKHVKDLKDSNLVEEQCSTMKEISSELQMMAKADDINELLTEFSDMNFQ